MMEQKENAKAYAEGKVLESLNKVVEQAYLDGYTAGYNDGKQNAPFEVVNVEYVDLGLPSGTLWSENFSKDNEGKDILYLPYIDACKLNIPTKEQLDELLSECQIVKRKQYGRDILNSITIVGPNGERLSLQGKGYKKVFVENQYDIYFWLKTDDIRKGNKKSCYNIKLSESDYIDMFTGFRLPVLLVR